MQGVLVVCGAIVALVLSVVAALLLRDALRAARFLLGARRLAPDPSAGEDVTLEPQTKKLTPDEEDSHQRALWAQFYRSGLSGAKLNALQRLREQRVAFILGDWMWRIEWRSWCRLAREATGAFQADALAQAKSMALGRYEAFSPEDLALFLSFYPEAEARSMEQRWASRNVAVRRRSALALRRLETLAERDDAAGAEAFRSLLEFFCGHRERERAAAVFARLRSVHPAAAAEFLPRLQQAAGPAIYLTSGTPGGRQVFHFSHASSASFRLAPLHFDESLQAAGDWLRSPPAASQGHPQKDTLQGALRLFRFPFSSRSVGLLRLPRLRGSFQLVVGAEPVPFALWSKLLPEVPLVSAENRAFVQENRIDAVLTLTESSASLWVIDRDTGRPVPDARVSFWLRDNAEATPGERGARTDERGLAVLPEARCWQLGASVRRPGSHGAEEFLFLTHNRDISTSAALPTEGRLLLWLARPLYRPGEVVQGKLVGRFKTARGPSARLHEGSLFVLEARGPRGNAVAQLRLTLSRFGSASFSFALPADAPLGRYSFVLVQGGPVARVEGHFQVEEFVAPEFRASLRALAPPRWGRPLDLQFEASYFFGGPVAGASGVIELRRRPFRHGAWAQWPPGKILSDDKILAPLRFQTDAAGKAKIVLPWGAPFDLLRRLDGHDLDLKATLRDASGKTCEAQLTLSFARVAHAVEVTASQKLRLPGEPLPLKLRWFPASEGEPEAYDLELTFRSGRARRRHTVRVRTDQDKAELPLRLPPGEWTFTCKLTGQRRPTQAPQSVWVLGERLSASGPRLLLSRGEVGPDAPVRVAVVAPRGPLSVLLVGNRGAHLRSWVLCSEGNAAWIDLPLPEGTSPKVHLQAWRSSVEKTHQIVRMQGSLDAPEPPAEPLPGAGLSLAFPAASARPGSITALSVSREPPDDMPAELLCTVVDEAIFSLVPAPASAIEFFEKPPTSTAPDMLAWSASWAGAQAGRYPAYTPTQVYGGGQPLTRVGMDERQASTPFHGLAMPAMAMAPQSAAPRGGMSLGRSMAGLSAAPAFAQAEMAKEADDAVAADELDGAGGGAAGGEAPIALRSDFSTEAAWYPEVSLAGAGRKELTVVLPDTLTTWKASALLLTLDERLGEAEARVRTEKPLMVRLQAPRFLQERDQFTLRVLVDSRSEQPLSVRASIDAPGLSLDAPAEFSFSLDPGGQQKLEAQARVLAAAPGDVRLRALARSQQDAEAADLEERLIPGRPYGVVLRQTAQGVLEEGRERVRLSLPEARRKEHTALSVRVDRGPLDAVLHGLNYLREYPYGCVEQTCSRLLPHLVWERVVGAERGEREGYRAPGPASDEVTAGLERLLAMQNGDGGFGWWPSGISDVWMTAYLLFSFSIARRPAAPALQAASRFLRANLLNARNADDADAFAAFALAWTGEPVDDRVFDVLLPRWDGLSLTEQAKLCLPLRAARHPEASSRTAAVRRKLVRGAKAALKKMDPDESPDRTQWYVPRTTEAIAFFVLALLHDAGAPGPDAIDEHGETLGLLSSFLLLHRTGALWHSTRDTALAVLALLTLEERAASRAAPSSLRVTLNGHERMATALGGLDQPAPWLVLRDDALQSGDNALELVAEGLQALRVAQPRHYTVELSYYSTEDEIAATEEGLSIERVYWLLDDKQARSRRLKGGERIAVGQRLRVVFTVRAAKPRRYLLLEDPKLAGCEPLAKKSGREVCAGRCDHVELRSDRTAIFLSTLGEEAEELSYDVEAQTPGVFTAMPARIETMYDSGCSATSGSFRLAIEP